MTKTRQEKPLEARTATTRAKTRGRQGQGDLTEHQAEYQSLISYITKQTNGDVFFWYRPFKWRWIDYRFQVNVFNRLGEGVTTKQLRAVFDLEYKPNMKRHVVGGLFGRKRFWDSCEKLPQEVTY